jgi:hypothetical protein
MPKFDADEALLGGLDLGFPYLMDGGTVTAPTSVSSVRQASGIAENTGVAPDIEVELDLKSVAGGHDPQLECAVTIALDELRKNRRWIRTGQPIRIISTRRAEGVPKQAERRSNRALIGKTYPVASAPQTTPISRSIPQSDRTIQVSQSSYLVLKRPPDAGNRQDCFLGLGRPFGSRP